MNKTFYSNGKLLLTGEYLVLDGAIALAAPTQFGQSLEVKKSTKKHTQWQSFDLDNRLWFKATLDSRMELLSSSDTQVGNTLSNLLRIAREMNPAFLSSFSGTVITTKLGFPQNWGLGSSSTLINNIAQWAKVDAFALLEHGFGGSGYDIAAAQRNSSFLFRHTNEPIVREVHLPWEFKEQLFFVFLNEKQNSKEGILRYRSKKPSPREFERISNISEKLLCCYSLNDFKVLMEAHEDIISKIIELPKVKDRLFPDYRGCIKSLGAWGGDFVMVTGEESDMEYFRIKGYSTIIPFAEMFL